MTHLNGRPLPNIRETQRSPTLVPTHSNPISRPETSSRISGTLPVEMGGEEGGAAGKRRGGGGEGEGAEE